MTETDPSKYLFNHTMIRVKDKDASFQFYQDVMGMSLIWTLEMEAMGFNLYFFGYKHGTDDGVPSSQREGQLELMWTYGTEKDPDLKYHSGNEPPQGFGHIAISVDDLDKACERFESRGVNWKKRLTDGRMKNVAFVLDPDGYWIEVWRAPSYDFFPERG